MKAVSIIIDLVPNSAPVCPEHLLADIPGWDSLKMVRLVLQIEGLLDRQLEESEVETLERVSDVQRLVDGKS